MTVPDRWEKYTSFGKVIPKTNIIAFKVPLKEVLLQKTPEDEWFTPSLLIQQTRDQGINLGLVIDLTFTRKYYDPLEFTQAEIDYKKIFTKGHTVPTDEVYTEFASAIKELDKDKVVGVHCTHGINRTGYLICRYMIEELVIKPDKAIRMFGKARGHEMERDNYLEDLRSRIPGELTPVTAKNMDGQRFDAGKARWRHNRSAHPGWRGGQSSGMEDGWGERNHASGDQYHYSNQSTENGGRGYRGRNNQGPTTGKGKMGYRGRGYHSWNGSPQGYGNEGYGQGNYHNGYQDGGYSTGGHDKRYHGRHDYSHSQETGYQDGGHSRSYRDRNDYSLNQEGGYQQRRGHRGGNRGGGHYEQSGYNGGAGYSGGWGQSSRDSAYEGGYYNQATSSSQKTSSSWDSSQS